MNYKIQIIIQNLQNKGQKKVGRKKMNEIKRNEKQRNEKAYKNKNQLNGSMKKILKIEGNQTQKKENI